jgi:hypothetical protein
MTVGVAMLALSLVLSVATSAQTRKPPPANSREFWKIIKDALTAPDGQDYFENNLKGAMVPGGAGGLERLTGTLVSAEPAAQPAVLIVAISDARTPEVTLRLKDADWNDTHLNGPLMPGSVIEFEGVTISFVKEPFMLTFGISMTKRSRNLSSASSGRDSAKPARN